MAGPGWFQSECERLLSGCSIPLAAISLVFLSGCSTTVPVTSLCELDFVNKTCWVSKKKNKSYSFEQMAIQQSRCREEPNTPCLYSIDFADLTRIMNALD